MKGLLGVVLRSRRLAWAFTALALCSASFVNAQNDFQMPAESSRRQLDGPQLVLTVTVTDRVGNPVPVLEKSSFTIFDERALPEITHSDAAQMPSSIGILFDTSGSMQNPSKSYVNVKEFVKTGLRTFIQSINPLDEYFLIGFSSQAQLLSDWGREDISILDRITDQKLKGVTALFDACYMGIEKVLQGRNKKRLIIIISDGSDNNSKRRLSELKQMIKANSVLIYAIGVFVRDIDSSDYELFRMAQGRLGEMAVLSGGKVFFADSPDKTKMAFEAIARELRAQYSIGFKAANPTGKKTWHSIKVKVTPPPNFPPDLQPLIVRSRQGYNALSHAY